MDLIDQVAGTQPVNLDDYLESKTLAPLQFPDAAIKNRAAMTAMLSDNPEGIVQDYQAMVSEAQQGVDYTREAIKRKADSATEKMDMQTIMSVLADPSLDQVAKAEAINSINSGFAKDTTTMVGMAAAMQPSKGENIEQEDVRILGAEQFRGVMESRQAIQALKNKHGATLNADTSSAILDFLETIIPLATNINAADTLKKISDELKIGSSTGEVAVLPGSAMVSIREAIANTPPSQLMIVSEKIENIIRANKGIIFTQDNDFVEYMLMQQIFDEGGYDTLDKWLDNAVGVLDIVGLGGTLKAITRFARSGRTLEEVERAVEVRAVTDTTSPVSPAAVLADTNPDRARSAYEMVVRSEGDEAAEAMYGTTRAEAIASEHIPQPAVEGGAVAARLPDPDRNLRVINPDGDAVEAFYDSGAYYLTNRERIKAQAHVTNDFINNTGMVPLDNMTTVGLEGRQLVINATYGTTEGGFLRAEEAVAQAKFALKEYGIDDRHITVLRKDGAEYVPVNLKDVEGVDGNYIIQVKNNVDISPEQIGGMDAFDVKRNWADFIPMFRSKNAGTLARTLLDAASMLHPRITGGASVANDMAVRVDKALITLHDNFASAYKALPKARQEKLYEHIKEANFKGLELSDVDLMAKGFNASEISAIKDWRKAWDTHFWFENADLARTLDIQGFRLLDHPNARLFAKEVKQKNGNIAHVYDPASDSIVTLSRQEMDTLYNNGGYYARLRRPTQLQGQNVEHIIVRNTPQEYLRKINATDQVLNYRKGYYQINYKAPKFVTQVVRDPSGNVIGTKVIATADNTAEAEHFKLRESRNTGTPLEDFDVRGDIKQFAPDSDAFWDLQSVSGRVAQRHRGKRLEDASAPVTISNSSHIADPVESSVRAARSLSGRIATRDFLEMSKQRALQQYGKFFPKDNMEKPMWVDDSSSLVEKGKMVGKDIADARTTVEYLNYLQHGYTNGLDEGFKGVMQFLANGMAKVGANKAEEAFLWGTRQSPLAAGKKVVFHSYIGTYPLRQLIIQAHQATRLMGYNTRYFFTGLSGDVAKYVTGDKALVKFVEDSGMIDAIDRHNMIRGAIEDVGLRHNVVTQAGGKVLDFTRSIGFDTGEKANIIVHLLTVRDKFIKQGKNVADKTVRDEIYSTARALSYDMNFAGDFPYNQNSMSLIMQFFQVPHKAITSVTTNRRIPWQDKLRLAMSDMFLWGVPGSAVISNIVGKDMLPEDPAAREAVVFGVESLVFNRLFSNLAGKDIGIDFSSLSPYSVEGWAKMFTAILSGGFIDLANNSPASNIFWKEGSRMKDALGRMMRYTGAIDPYEGMEPESMLSVLDGVVSISSGWTNAMKARTILESGKITNKQGVVLMEDAGYIEAAAKLFGFASQEEVLYYAAQTELREGTKAWKEDRDKWYKGYQRLLTRETKLSNMDEEYVIKVLGTAKLVFKNNPKDMEYINGLLLRDMPSMKDKLIMGAIEYAGIPKGSAGVMTSLNNLTMLKDEDIENVRRMMKDIQDLQEEE